MHKINLSYFLTLKTSDFVRQSAGRCEFADSKGWVVLTSIENRIKDKIHAIGIPLKDWDVRINYGIKTGYNEAFIIDGFTRNKILEADAKSAEIIRPILRGRDVKRYRYDHADVWLIATFPSLKIDIEKYPAVKQHLLTFGHDRLKQTGDIGARKKTNNKWFETQDSISYWDDFYKQKIVWGEISDKSNFALDNQDNFFVNNKCYLLTGHQLEYLVCYLNSPLSEYLFSKIGTTTGVGTAQWSKFTIEQLHVPVITQDQNNEFIKLLTELENNQINMAPINNLVYSICNLTHEEVAFIEGL